MFERNDYRAAMSALTASDRTRQEVMNMAKNHAPVHRSGARRIAVLAAAAALLTAMTVTAFAAEDIAGWFRSFFAGRSKGDLTEGQLSYIQQQEQMISQGKTCDGWTVELLSVMHDDAAGYLIFRVTAPEEIPLEPEATDGNIIFGNFSRKGFYRNRPDLLKASEGIILGGWGFQWTEDGDGKNHTRNFVIHIAPDVRASRTDPFGPEAEYSVHIENIVRETVDEQLRRQLQLEKEKDDGFREYTDEELDRIYQEELLAEGIWDFTACFSGGPDTSGEYVEMLTEPIGTDCMFSWFEDGEMQERQGRLQLYSVKMRHLSVSFHYGACEGYPDLSVHVKVTSSNGSGFVPMELSGFTPCVVRKDGTEIPLLYYGFGSNDCLILEAKSPIVFEEVSHIRMADGTVIPMPESE